VELNEQLARNALSGVLDPNTGKDLVTAEIVKGVAVVDGKAAVELQFPYPMRSQQLYFQASAQSALKAAGFAAATVNVSSKTYAHQVRGELTPLPGVKNILAIASGKGGVGKSTTAVNLALALQAEGARVGVLDADIYGPSVPRMLGTSGKPDTVDGRLLEPKMAHGLQVMSIGLMIDEDTAMIWRGPMVTQALQQMLNETRWDNLDYLVIDLPPGTGDIQLTLCQRVPVSAAIIVTTPQDIALLDAKKALKMFEKVEVPVLGIVENMSTHICSSCGHEEPIFGSGGGASMALQYSVPLLGQLPLAMQIRSEADSGTPTVAADPDSAISATYKQIARQAAAALSGRARSKAFAFPKIVVEQ
jgi:ATP-binding protein involved in chromosome partitioning